MDPEITVHVPVTCQSSLRSICQAFHDLSTPQTSSAWQATFSAFKRASSFRSSFSLSKSSTYLLPSPPEPTSRNCLILTRFSSGPSASFFRRVALGGPEGGPGGGRAGKAGGGFTTVNDHSSPPRTRPQSRASVPSDSKSRRAKHSK